MRNRLAVLSVAVLMIGLTGCLNVQGEARVESPARHAVALDGEIYIVNDDGSAVYKIDKKAIDHAKTLRPKRR